MGANSRHNPEKLVALFDASVSSVGLEWHNHPYGGSISSLTPTPTPTHNCSRERIHLWKRRRDCLENRFHKRIGEGVKELLEECAILIRSIFDVGCNILLNPGGWCM
jgi:hypothetical protein